jgi:membrane protease YdiL (CAAX protease family)
MDELTLPPEPASPAFPAPQPVPAPQDHGIEWILFGRNGLRAGWGIAVFIVLFLVFITLDGILLRVIFHFGGKLTAFTPREGIIGEISQVLAVFLATAVMALIERRPILSYGYRGTARGVRFLSGLLYGFAAIAILVFILWKAGYLAFDGIQLHGAAVWEYGLGWGIVFLATGFFEESLLRGYVLYTMTRGVGFWWGALLFSVLFGLIHTSNPGESPVGIFAAGAVGLVFCISLWYTGSLWWAVGFHAAWDWGESYFFGTSDSGLVAQGHLLGEHPVGKILWSGGLTGPEGSIVVLPLLLLVALLMIFWWGRRVRSPFAGSGWAPLWAQSTHAAPHSEPQSPLPASL